MDVDILLNIERRTGVKNDEIDEFTRKASEVEAAIKGMLDGTLNPDDVKIEGIETEEEKRKKEVERQERLRKQKEKDEVLRLQRKQEEKERWWAGAELYKPNKQAIDDLSNDPDASSDPKLKVVQRYTADYSRWNSWVPTDEATKLEQKEQETQLEDQRNQEFEKNNPEFCKQFTDDMEARKKNAQKKQESSDILRLKGNKFYTAKQYERSLELYVEALKETPFDPKILLNVAQAHIKLKCLEDAAEFVRRTLYLDPENVKALSRKALVESELGNYSAAMDAIEHALRLDPANKDLLAQQKEVSIIAKEKAVEQAVMARKLQPEASAAAAEQSVSGESKSPGKPTVAGSSSLVETVATKLREAHASREGFSSELLGMLEGLERDSAADSSNAVLLRTTGVLQLVADVLLQPKDQQADASVWRKVLSFLGAAVDGQRANKLLVFEAKIVALVRERLKGAVSQLIAGHSAESVSLVKAHLQFLHVCCKDDVCTKTQQSVFADKELLVQISHVVGNLSEHLLSAKSADIDADIEVVGLCATISRNASFSDAGKASIHAGCGSVVCALGVAMHVLHLRLGDKKTLSSVTAAIESCIEALVGLSQVECLREFFIVSCPIGSEKTEVTAVSATLRAIEQVEGSFGNALAILMNCCVESSAAPAGSVSAIRDAVVACGGLKFISNYLHLSDAARAAQEPVILVRMAGLMSRLSSTKKLQEALLEPKAYGVLCRRIVEAPGEHSWKSDEQLHYIRTLAALPAPSAACKAVAVKERLMEGILALFPMPRDDGGVVTPETVTRMPLKPASAQLLGNAARCLMPYADDSESSKTLFEDKKVLGVEKLICAMATCTDIRVRRNIAIMLAKGCRKPEVREKVSKFRGLQMMIELQDKL